MIRTLALSLVLAAPAFAVTVGQPAPAFTATDSNGKVHRLADFKGKPVVLEWTNSGCPFVKKHYGAGNMQETQAAATKAGAVWLTVNSGAPGKQGHVDAKGANAEVAANKAKPTAYLLDPTGAIGRAYDAKTTPHIYVIDAKGNLAYQGAIDDKPTADPADIKGATNLALAALNDVKAGKPVKVATSKPYGCAVKYG
ncbi:redoxin domain-containing protein [Glacieibacterium frigidum]|uniref:Redoxin domain-containing protein n=1 Tax=Glacieibacterium frigidum TaxID=2593303 RepID=A0A552UIN3_9SPHN|nr:redoxin domain-containing protein [Glacieibacterium frigidum]TRW18051.1 redoxin domain-containing protein [Glacieibacterium frigidum]